MNRFTGLFCLVAFALSGLTVPLQAQVTTTADSGPGSLRQVIADAAPADTITFANTLSGQAVLLTNGHIILNKDITIDGSSLPEGITLDADGSGRIFFAPSNAAPYSITLDSLNLTGGSVGGGTGGAIVLQAPNATLTIRRSTFHNNHADVNSGDGGAILSRGHLVMENCTFTQNSAADRGGAIRLRSGSGTFRNVTIVGNQAFQGGGIQIDSAILTLTNTIAANNSASRNANIDGNIAAGSNNLTSGDALLDLLGDYGGPTPTMPPLPGSPAIDAGDNSVTNLLTMDQRGYNRLLGSAVDIGAVEFTFVVQNMADSGAGSLREAIAEVAPGSVITFANSLSGGSIRLSSGQLVADKSLTIDASRLPEGITLDGNTNSRIFEFISSTTNTLVGLTLTNGNAYHPMYVQRRVGGAILAMRTTLTISNCTITGNRSGLGGRGGGIHIDNGTLTLHNSSVCKNWARTGGGISVTNLSTIAISNCTITGNRASSGDGGGIYHHNFRGNFTLDNSTLSGNSARDGGGIYNQFGTTTFSDVTLSGNFGNFGGGIYNRTEADLTLFDSFLSENEALRGGGIYNIGDLTLYNATLSGNTARLGGGLYVHSFVTNLIARNINISENSASDFGGGIYYGGENLMLQNAFLSRNSATNRGGGIYVNNASSNTLTNVILTGNSATKGGGLYLRGTSSMTLTQVTLSENSALEEGGGILVATNASLAVSNGSLWGNSAVSGTGGGIICKETTTLTLNNATLYKNFAGSGAGGIFSLSLVNMTNTIVTGNIGTSLTPNIFAWTFLGTNNITFGDALLAPLGDYGGPTPTMPPLTGSPAIDAGRATTLTTDQRGYPRVSGIAVDIGAVEAQLAPPGNPPFLMGAGQSEDDEVFRFVFTNAPNADFSVLTATNLISSPWTILGPVKQTAPGQYEFHDPDATNFVERYYQVTSP